MDSDVILTVVKTGNKGEIGVVGSILYSDVLLTVVKTGSKGETGVVGSILYSNHHLTTLALDLNTLPSRPSCTALR